MPCLPIALAADRIRQRYQLITAGDVRGWVIRHIRREIYEINDVLKSPELNNLSEANVLKIAKTSLKLEDVSRMIERNQTDALELGKLIRELDTHAQFDEKAVESARWFTSRESTCGSPPKLRIT